MLQHIVPKATRFVHFIFILILIGSSLAATATQAQTDMPWMDTSLPPEKRAKLLLNEMTLDEKIAMVSGDNEGSDGGYVGHISAIPRLGIPELNMKDGPSGVGNGAINVTAFPAPITVASTWDVDLMQQYGTYMAEEQRDKGVNVHLAPMMNINRAPQAGRNFEGYGEDPYLSSQMAAATVGGIQSTGLIAVAKHYIDNEQEILRTEASSEIDIRTQHEIYLPPFKASVDAGVGAIMCSYNKINGIYACENSQTQNDLLKGELGFDGWIMSDWNATHSTIESAMGGLDMEMPIGVYYGRSLKGTIEAGQVPMTQLDDMVLRILTSMFRAGLFDREPGGSPNSFVQSDAHTALTRTAAAQGMVLLKNENSILPLDTSNIKSIAVFGKAADVDPVIVGGGSGHVNEPYHISPLQGIKNRAGENITVSYFDFTIAAGQPIPEDVYQTPDGKTGLKAEYFNTTDLSGEPVLISTSPNIDYSWNDDLGVNNFSVRWTGVLKPKVSGIYNLALTGRDSRLYLDDELIIDTAENDQSQIYRKRLIMDRAYNIRVESVRTEDANGIQLTWYTPEQNFNQDAAAIAAEADVAIVIAGINSSEGNDRQSLEIPDDELIQAIADVNPNTIVVVYSPAQVLMPWNDSVPSILLGWIPGQEAGNSLADVLFGDVNPSGKLTMTFARNEDDYPANESFLYPGRDLMVQYAEGLQVGYRHFDAKNIEPLYPFGFGLSYTTFEYSNITITPTQSDSTAEITVTVDVKNTGQRTGAEVVQVYLGFPSETSEPPKQLKGFAKINLQPDETQTVSFTLTPDEYSFWSAGMDQWVAYPGEYQVMIGSSTRDIHQTGTFNVTNELFNGEIVPAENALLTGGATLADEGFISGFNSNGSAAQFKVNVEDAGEYDVIVRYASTLRPGEQNTPRTLSLYVNGIKQDQIQFPNLANWEMWDFKAEIVTLSAGDNTVTIRYDAGDSGDVHVDSITVVKYTAPTPTPEMIPPFEETTQLSKNSSFMIIGLIVLTGFIVFFAVRFLKNRNV